MHFKYLKSSNACTCNNSLKSVFIHHYVIKILKSYVGYTITLRATSSIVCSANRKSNQETKNILFVHFVQSFTKFYLCHGCSCCQLQRHGGRTVTARTDSHWKFLTLYVVPDLLKTKKYKGSFLTRYKLFRFRPLNVLH
jgi:hypothetical protein